eukprot:223535-Rhodomonas_salina.1
MAMGLPVIVTNHSGPQSYMSAENAYPIKCTPAKDKFREARKHKGYVAFACALLCVSARRCLSLLPSALAMCTQGVSHAWRAFTQKLLRACASLAEVCPCACLNQQHARARASGRSKPTVLIGGFAEPDFEHLMELLVRVRENPREARAKGRKVSVAAQPCGAL